MSTKQVYMTSTDLRVFRAQFKLSQDDVGRILGVSRVWVSYLENDRERIKPEHVEKLQEWKLQKEEQR